MPFAIVDRASGRVIGSTRFWKIDRKNRKLEIGHTWLSESAQRTRANTEAKWLLLGYAFDVLHCVRVQFTTDELNEKSRAAILRLGAKQEGSCGTNGSCRMAASAIRCASASSTTNGRRCVRGCWRSSRNVSRVKRDI